MKREILKNSSFAQEESRSVGENCKWHIRGKFKQGIPTNFRIFEYDFVGNQKLDLILNFCYNRFLKEK